MRKEIKIDNLNIPEEPNNFIVPFRFERSEERRVGKECTG